MALLLLLAAEAARAQQPDRAQQPEAAWPPAACADRSSPFIWDPSAPCAPTDVAAVAALDESAAAADALAGQTRLTLTVRLQPHAPCYIYGPPQDYCAADDSWLHQECMTPTEMRVVGAAGLTVAGAAGGGSVSWSPQPEVAELYQGLGDVLYFPAGTTGTATLVVKPALPLESLLPQLRVQVALGTCSEYGCHELYSLPMPDYQDAAPICSEIVALPPPPPPPPTQPAAPPPPVTATPSPPAPTDTVRDADLQPDREAAPAAEPEPLQSAAATVPADTADAAPCPAPRAAAAHGGRDAGSVLGQPAVVIAFLTVYVAMAVSLFGAFTVRMPQALEPLVNRCRPSGQDVEGKTKASAGYCQSFTMGCTFGAVAAPCVGPFAASALAFVAQTQNVLIGLIAMFFFGLGLSSTLLVVALVSSCSTRLTALTRATSGASKLVRVKHHGGFIVLLIAAAFLQNLGDAGLTARAAGAVATAWALFTLVTMLCKLHAPSVLARMQQAVIPALAADGATVVVAASAAGAVVVAPTAAALAGSISLLAGTLALLAPTVLLARQSPDGAGGEALVELPIKPSELAKLSVSKLCSGLFLLWAVACALSVLSALVGVLSLPECPSSQERFYAWALVYLSVVGPALRVRAALLARAATTSTDAAADSDAASGTVVVVAGYRTCPFFAKAQGHAERLAASGVYQVSVQEFGSRDLFQAFLEHWKQTNAKDGWASAQSHRTCPLVWLAPAEVENPVADAALSTAVDGGSSGLSAADSGSVTAFVGGCDDLCRVADEKCAVDAAAAGVSWVRLALALCASMLVCAISYAATSQAVTGYAWWWPPSTLTAEPPAASLISWEHEFEAALVRAAEEQKPLFIDFYARWCGPCRHMAFSTLADPAVVAMATTNFISLKQDCSESTSAAAMLKQSWNIHAVRPLLAACICVRLAADWCPVSDAGLRVYHRAADQRHRGRESAAGDGVGIPAKHGANDGRDGCRARAGEHRRRRRRHRRRQPGRCLRACGPARPASHLRQVLPVGAGR